MNKTRSKIISISAAVITMVLGILVILGWLTDSNYLKSLVPGTVTMKFNAALGFICSSGVVLLCFFPGKNKMRNGISVLLCVIVSLIGLITLLEYFFGYNPGIDEFFIKDRIHPIAYFAGRMSPLSATNFPVYWDRAAHIKQPKSGILPVFLPGSNFFHFLIDTDQFRFYCGYFNIHEFIDLCCQRVHYTLRCNLFCTASVAKKNQLSQENVYRLHRDHYTYNGSQYIFFLL